MGQFRVLNCCKNYDIDASRIYPFNQHAVCCLSAGLKYLDKITEAYVFGSSLTDMCNIYSDIDVALSVTEDCTIEERSELTCILQTITCWRCDFVWLDRITETERLYFEIMKGLKIK